MLRKFLLPMLAASVMAGCATDYQYRGGNGDYYYGQPQVEYRQLGSSGYYGGIGFGFGGGYGGYGGIGYGATYFYDRYGRLVYGYPGGYYGSPYYGRHGSHHPRPPHDHGGDDEHHDNQENPDDAANGADRRPPWRDLGQLRTRDPEQDLHANGDTRERQVRRPQPEMFPSAPMRMQRLPAAAPAPRERGEASPRLGEHMSGAERPRGKRKVTTDE